VRPSYKKAVAVVYVLGVFIQILDATVVNVALPAIGDDFGVPANEVEWVVLGYLLTLIIGIPTAAWVADRFGSKWAFIASLIGFVAASVLCGLAPTLPWLIGARLLQGLPAGLITPVGAAILYRAYPQNERATAAAAVVGVAVVAPSIGPVLGGVIVDNLSWPWIFYVNVPVGLLAIALAWAWLREEASEPAADFDWTGFTLAAVGLAGLLYALSAGPRAGWLTAPTIGAAVVGLVGLVALVLVELSADHPMVDLRLLADRHFRTVNLIGLSLYAAFLSLIYVLPLYLQTHRGLSATDAGTTQVPQAFGVFLVSNLMARRVYKRFGPRAVMSLSVLAAMVVSALFAFVGEDTSLWVLRAGTLARGLAIGFVFVAIQTAAYATTSLADTGRAVAIFSTQRQVASAVGVALAATVLTSTLNVDLGLTAYRAAFAVSALLFLPAILWSTTIRPEDVANTVD
jgi:EmrB/QacA subfamily drug resistance transporter